MLIFGLSAGFAAGTTNVMVPILIIYTLGMGLTTTAMVQIFNLCFLAGKSTQIVVFSGAGMLDTRLLISTSPLVAVALTAQFLGMNSEIHTPSRTKPKRAAVGIGIIMFNSCISKNH